MVIPGKLTTKGGKGPWALFVWLVLVLTGHSQRMPLVAVLRVQLLWALVLRGERGSPGHTLPLTLQTQT